jgi:hypothetical protein
MAGLLLLALLAGLEQAGHVCQGPWCHRLATKRFQDGPNCVQYPTRHFCDRCSEAFLAQRRKSGRSVDPRHGKVAIGNQWLDPQELPSKDARAVWCAW